MKVALVALVALTAISANAEQLKIKYTTTVDIVEDGKSVGQRKLKPGTIIEIVQPQPEDEEGKGAKDAKKSSAKAPARKILAPSNMSPAMFANLKTPGTVLRADVRLGSSFLGTFNGKDAEYWNISIDLLDKDWEWKSSVDGYVKRDSDVGRRIVKLVEDGEQHRALVKLSPVKGETFHDIYALDDFDEVKK